MSKSFVEQVASLFYICLQQVIDKSQLKKCYERSIFPAVRIQYFDKTKNYKVEWRYGKITRYRYLTKSQVRNLVNKPSIIVRIAKLFKGIELC